MVALVVVVGLGVAMVLRSRQQSLIPKRGFGIAADMDGLADAQRVRVQSVTRTAPDRVRVVFEAEAGTDLEFVVALEGDDFGSGLLDEWRRDGSAIAMVLPPQSRLVRLRSTESLQHLTLHRVDEA